MWVWLNEYGEDELAEYSDKEKHLYRAKMQAGCKATVTKNRKKKRVSQEGLEVQGTVAD